MLNVVVASDDNYVPLVLISLTSLLENNADDFDCISIHVLDDGIADANRDRIRDLAKKYPCEISFVETKKLDSVDITILGIEKDLTGISLTTYARLFASSLLPKDIKKALYLDCDALIVGSFKELWDMNIDDYYCAGVQDTLNENLLKYFGFEKDPYINGGFFLANLEKWREDNVEKRFFEFLSENQDKFYFHDQGVLNEVFRGKIKIVEPKYNLQFYFQYYDYDLARKFKGIEGEYYSKEIVDESRNNPVFLHFCGYEYDRPWHNKDHKYAKEFERYAKMADCEDVIKFIEAPTLKAKLFYKGADNKLIRLLLRLIPSKTVKNIVDNNGFELFEREKQKMIESNEN